MARQVGRGARRGGRGHVLVRGGVEAGDGVLVEGGGGDEGDVGAGVEGLVLGAVEVGSVEDLEGGVRAGGDGGGLVGDGEARVAGVDFRDGGAGEAGEVGLGLGVWDLGVVC